MSARACPEEGTDGQNRAVRGHQTGRGRHRGGGTARGRAGVADGGPGWDRDAPARAEPTRVRGVAGAGAGGAVRAVPRGERPPCPPCGGLLRLVEQARGRDLQGLTGDATLVRPTYVCTRADGGRRTGPCAARCGARAGRGDADAAAGAGGVPGGHQRGLRRGGGAGARGSRRRGGRRDGAPGDGSGRRGGGGGGGAAGGDRAGAAGRPDPPAGGARDLVVAVDGCPVHLEDAWHEMHEGGRAAPRGPAVRTDHRTGRT